MNIEPLTHPWYHVSRCHEEIPGGFEIAEVMPPGNAITDVQVQVDDSLAHEGAAGESVVVQCNQLQVVVLQLKIERGVFS